MVEVILINGPCTLMLFDSPNETRLLYRMTGMPPHALAIARRDLQGAEDRQSSLMGALLCMQAEMMVNLQHLPECVMFSCSL